MKILVVSGGRGSVALQKGLHALTGKNCDNLINMYDDGDSTGVAKRICGTLAAADMRKNHALKYELNGKANPTIMQMFQKRFDIKSQLQEYLYSELQKIDDENFRKLCTEGAETYLSCEYTIAKYKDFSLPNIIYDGLYKKYGVKEAEKKISEILALNATVHHNSSEVLRLCGMTEKGRFIPNEYELSSYNDPEDRIKEIFLLDKQDRKKIPLLDTDAEKALLEADIIIFSAGTQWSSLIPTYITKGFIETLEKSKAMKYLVINAGEDGDTKGYTAQDFYNLAARFLPIKELRIISHAPLKAEHCVIVNESIIEGKKHNPLNLARTIIEDFQKT